MARVYAQQGILPFCAWAASWFWSPSAAAAQQVPLAFEWLAPTSECPTQDTLIRQVSELVESQSTSSHPVRAVAKVDRLDDKRYQAVLTTESQGSRGLRVLEERSCQALADLVVLILAWMIQPDSGAAPPPAAPKQELGSVDRARSPVSPISRSSNSEWNLSLRAAGDLGSLPEPALGGLVGIGYRAGSFQLSLQGHYFPSGRSEVAPLSGFLATGGRFSFLALSLLGCFEPTRARVALCAGPELGHLRGLGFGVSSPGSGQKSWLSLALGLRSALKLWGGLWLETAAEAVVPTLRESFVLEGIGVVHRASAVSGRASLGLGLSL